MRRLILFILLPLLACQVMKGQRAMSWDDFVEYLMENEEYADEASWADYLEELEVLYQHPVDINTASPAQLQSIPLLSERQITDIIQYRDYHHGMHSLAELILIPSISYYERRYLPLFLYTNPRTEKDIPSSPLPTKATSLNDPTKASSLNDSTKASSLTDSTKASSLTDPTKAPTKTSANQQPSTPTRTLTKIPSSKLSTKEEWKSILDHAHHEWGTRLDFPLYHRRGFLVSNGYRGSHIYNKVYYRLETARHLSASLRTERDAGERGIDSYGAHIMLSDLPLLKRRHASPSDLRLKTLAVGDFKASFGLGLVMRQGFLMGKQTGTIRRGQGLRPHRSTDETNFMRGIGMSLQMGQLELTLLYSHRRWDATLDSTAIGTTPASEDGHTLLANHATPANQTTLASQTSQDGISYLPLVKTIVDNGYHRTAAEWKKKNVLGVNVVAGNVAWNHRQLHLGATGYLMRTDKNLAPGDAAYRRIYPHGNRFGSLGIDYSYEPYRWRIFGETAYGGSLHPYPSSPSSPSPSSPATSSTSPSNPTTSSTTSPSSSPRLHGLATLNGIEWRPSSRYILSLLQRYYSYNYYSFFSGAISESGGVQNETGVLVRLDATPWDAIHLASFVDLFYNPWPRYGLNKSSGGWNVMLQAQCTLNRRHSLSARYDAKSKEQSAGQELHHRLRLQWQASSASERWRCTTTAMLHTLRGSRGEALGTTLRYHPRSLWNMAASGLYFHTTDSKSRVYLYEPNVREMMYIPSMSGHGVRGSALVQCRLWKERILVELKYGVTRYFDRDTQGTGMQTIYSNVKNDISLQVRLKI